MGFSKKFKKISKGGNLLAADVTSGGMLSTMSALGGKKGESLARDIYAPKFKEMKENIGPSGMETEPFLQEGFGEGGLSVISGGQGGNSLYKPLSYYEQQLAGSTGYPSARAGGRGGDSVAVPESGQSTFVGPASRGKESRAEQFIKNPDILGLGLDAPGDLAAFSGKTAAEAAAKAADLIEKYGIAGIERLNQSLGVNMQDIAQGKMESLGALQSAADQAVSSIRGGEAGAISDITSGFGDGRDALLSGVGAQQRFLEQAGDQYDPIAALTSPALGNLSQAGTAGGAADIRADILSDPNQQAMLDMIQERTGRQLSEAGLRRSGAGAQMSNEALLNYVRGEEALQNQRQQQLAQIGMQGIGAQADILGQRGQVAGAGGLNLADLFTRQGLATGGVRQQAGLNVGNIFQNLGQGQVGAIGTGTQQALAQRGLTNQQIVDIIGDMASGQASAVTGGAQARQQGAANMGQGAMSLMSLFSDGRLKENIEIVGKDQFGPIYSWDWNDEAGQIGLTGSSQGRIAQELLKTHPEFVMQHESGYYMVNYPAIEQARLH